MCTKPIVEAFVRGCEETGVPEVADYNIADNLANGGVGHTQTTIRDGKRCDTATGYLFGDNGAFTRCANLHCLTFHQAAKVYFDSTGTVATGVEFIGGLVINARAEVILCAGAVGSPQILLLSGVGPKTHLESKNVRVVRDMPGVGQGMKDHIMATMFYKAKDTCPYVFAADSVTDIGRELIRYGVFNTGLFVRFYAIAVLFPLTYLSPLLDLNLGAGHCIFQRFRQAAGKNRSQRFTNPLCPIWCARRSRIKEEFWC